MEKLLKIKKINTNPYSSRNQVLLSIATNEFTPNACKGFSGSISAMLSDKHIRNAGAWHLRL
jgi:hypothetical protein